MKSNASSSSPLFVSKFHSSDFTTDRLWKLVHKLNLEQNNYTFLIGLFFRQTT